MHIKVSGPENWEGINKKEKGECFRMFPKYLDSSGHFPKKRHSSPQINQKGFVTKFSDLLIISQHTYKMNTCAKFSKWVSLFLIEYIFPEYISYASPLSYTNTWPLNSTEPGHAACFQPVHSIGIQGLVS